MSAKTKTQKALKRMLKTELKLLKILNKIRFKKNIKNLGL